MDESDFSEGNEDGEDAHEEILDPNNAEHTFAILERNFNKVFFFFVKAFDTYYRYFRQLMKLNKIQKRLNLQKISINFLRTFSALTNVPKS